MFLLQYFHPRDAAPLISDAIDPCDKDTSVGIQ